jgi:hypothetical protein
VFSDGSLAIVAKRLRHFVLAPIVCFPTGCSVQLRSGLTADVQ